MISQLKQALKEPFIQKQNNLYQAELDEKVLSYDTWIKRVEAAEGETSTSLSASIILYEDCQGYFELQNIKEEYLVFTSDIAGLDKDAVTDMLCYMSEHQNCELLYGDEDELNSNGTIRMNPWFKPDFSPDTLLSFFYFGNVFAIRVNAFRDIIWKSIGTGLLNVYDFCLQTCLGKTGEQICHIPKVLFHSHNLQALCTDDLINNNMLIAKSQYIERHTRSERPFVSIIILSKNQPKLLKNLFSSIYSRTSDISFEIILVDNGSNEENKHQIEELSKDFSFRYLYEKQSFNFARLCNFGAQNARGNYLLFLNDDMEIRQSDWLVQLVDKAKMTYVGAVGAKLYYPQSKLIQHAGITNLRLGPVHKLQFKEDKRSYYYHRNQYPVNVIAVTGACLMVQKERFENVGCFDEEFEVAFNDVELCFRLYEAGYQNVVCNNIHLWHYESFSRGNDEERDKQERLAGERELLYMKHPALYAKDPYYHAYLCNDILDTNYSCAYQYESGRNAMQMNPVLYKGKIKGEWENECLIISMEYAGSLEKWIDIADTKEEGLYFQGYAFVTGSDNSCYKRTLLLRHEESGQYYSLPFNNVFRPDLQMNLDERENALLCGFSIMINKSSLKAGSYQLGVLAKDCCSRQRLLRFCGKHIVI